MEHQGKIESLVRKELQSGFFTHCFVACGQLDEEAPRYEAFWSESDSSEKIFDLASLTKALVTGPLFFQLLRSLCLRPQDQLGAILRSDDRLPQALLELSSLEILGHHSGLPAWWNFWIECLTPNSSIVNRQLREDRITEVLKRIAPLDQKVDLYSDVGYILLGYVLEAIPGADDLQGQFSAWKTSLKFDTARFLDFPVQHAKRQTEFIKTSFCPIRQRWLQGEVHDENCAALGGVSGHAGLFGTGEALLDYLKALYQSSCGFDYLEQNYRILNSTTHEGLMGLRRGNGPSSEVFGQGRSMGHLGFTGTGFWIDWEKRSYAIVLTNRVISGRKSTHIQQLRRDLFGHLDAILR